MLLRQNFRRSKQCTLPTRVYYREHRPERHNRLSRTYLALKQSMHRMSSA
ncbi:hypothetical protein GALL_367340 [mine drainage metagenome]|uniref:Uncharacterized protein n=1 Tax=mine drainage metagenome TaxID=410659 RepID=A0A1J5QCZ8_9ZZZZ